MKYKARKSLVKLTTLLIIRDFGIYISYMFHKKHKCKYAWHVYKRYTYMSRYIFSVWSKYRNSAILNIASLSMQNNGLRVFSVIMNSSYSEMQHSWLKLNHLIKISSTIADVITVIFIADDYLHSIASCTSRPGSDYTCEFFMCKYLVLLSTLIPV